MDARTYRLICLWAFNESAIGGLMHGLKLPFTGLIVGGFATVLITLIGYFAKRTESLLLGLAVVLAIKAGLSPQSSFPAYFAVLFQGILGYLMFKLLRVRWWSAMLFAALALLESAIQKYLILTFYYGADWIGAFDKYVESVLKHFNIVANDGQAHPIFWLVSGYIGLYVVAGLIWAGFAWRLIRRIERERLEVEPRFYWFLRTESQILGGRGRKRTRWGMWALVVGLAVAGFVWPSSWSVVLPLILFFGSYLILFPMLGRLLTRFFQRRSDQNPLVGSVLAEVPRFYGIARFCWAEAAATGARWSRVFRFFSGFVRTALSYDAALAESRVFLLSGEVQTGKTTALRRWAEAHKPDCAGLLSPVVEGRRMLYDLRTGEFLAFERAAGSQEAAQEVGRFALLESGFAEGLGRLQRAWESDAKILILDELGKLELDGRGFDAAARAWVGGLSANADKVLLLVVRSGLVEQIRARYGLDSAIVLRVSDL